MRKFFSIFLLIFGFGLASCDLQPKIAAIPEGVGDFISSRYPAMLADPETQPEIYNSAAADYGVYESADLYGNENIDDYILYADADDYSSTKQRAITAEITETKSETPDFLNVPDYKKIEKPAALKEITVARGDTLYSLSKKHNVAVGDLAKINNLSAPYKMSVGQKLKLEKPVEAKVAEKKVVVAEVAAPKNIESKKPSTPTVMELAEITVAKGDTLYSLSRQYQLPVNDLAVINKLSAPFSLSLGQKIYVPRSSIKVAAKAEPAAKSNPIIAKKTDNKKVADNSVSVKKEKISSNPGKSLPKIASLSSSKFTWPVRGKILSGFGAKSNGLYNDGINISASRGASVIASENGVVAYAGNELKGLGNLIIIQHSGGWMTVYAHLGAMYATRGNRINVGQKIGTVGSSGKVDSPQLHFEIRKGTKSYDPTKKLK